MKAKPVALGLGLTVLAIVGLAAIGNRLSLISPRPPQTSYSSATSQLSGITLEDLIAGKFPTALDKHGTGGVTVTVRNLLVLYVRDESDGDWHVAVTDGRLDVFITEITPSYQSSIGRPAAGSTIDETGIAYCDTNHETESWHGNTCWEIHPVTSWTLSSGGTKVTTSAHAALGLTAAISYASIPISRGSTQTITVAATDSDGPIAGTPVSVNVLYASGQTTKDFACTTSTAGSCSVAWTIGGNSTPGTFSVTVMVEGTIFYSSFLVTVA